MFPPLPDPGCGAYNQGAAIRVNGRAWIVLGTMQQRPPNVSVNFGPFVNMPASVKPVGYFSLAAGAVPPPAPPPPVPPTATCTSMVFAHRSAISADVILAGTTPGLDYTVTANGRTAAFTDPHLANSCQPDLVYCQTNA
ncbi:MAG: hypothetical protein IPK02_02725 [Candidatus Accumulibacter sp.]|uniref:Uncharacterized protein n=1 Tax=Candidatus Accumulibacter affinis TaxID=2954384 RepID=A0A935TAQ3_9PROT|nr:hypothetical protein [Candidatus Accumulibacter affinis]